MFEKNQIFKWGYQISREPDKILEYKEVQVIRIPMINRELSSSRTKFQEGSLEFQGCVRKQTSFLIAKKNQVLRMVTRIPIICQRMDKKLEYIGVQSPWKGYQLPKIYLRM